jgi:hypothetical protein
VSLNDYTGMSRAVSELSPDFFNAWIGTLRESGWGGLLGRNEDWYFWMFVNGSRNMV